MSSTEPLPNLNDFLAAYSGGIKGIKNVLADTRVGSALDVPGGMSAVLFSRQVKRDKTLFENCYTDSATKTDLDRHIELKLKVSRIKDEYGLGFMILERDTLSDSFTIYQGTRVEYYENGKSFIYQVAKNTLVQNTNYKITIPIKPIIKGKTGALETSNYLRFLDSIDTPSIISGFTIAYLKCSDGTDFENDNDYRIRAKDIFKKTRIGYSDRLISTCLDQGAIVVIVLLSNTYDDDLDFALNNIYVADAGYSTSDELKMDCALALEDVRVFGADLQILGMEVILIDLVVNLYLYDNPSDIDLLSLEQSVTDSIIDYFEDQDKFWLFRINSLQGMVKELAYDLIENVTITSSIPEPDVEFPPILPKYRLNKIKFNYYKA
jgi:hypothetical protein